MAGMFKVGFGNSDGDSSTGSNDGSDTSDEKGSGDKGGADMGDTGDPEEEGVEFQVEERFRSERERATETTGGCTDAQKADGWLEMTNAETKETECYDPAADDPKGSGDKGGADEAQGEVEVEAETTGNVYCSTQQKLDGMEERVNDETGLIECYLPLGDFGQIMTTEEIAAGMASWKSEFIAQLKDAPPSPELMDATKIAAECPVFGNLVPNVYIEKVAVDPTPGVKIILKMIDQRNDQGLYSIIGNDLLEQYLKVVCVLSDDTSLSNSIKAIFNAGIYRESWFEWTTDDIVAATATGNEWGIPDALSYEPPPLEEVATRIHGMPFSQSIYASDFEVDASDSFKIILLKDFEFDLGSTLQAQSEGTQNSDLETTWEAMEFPYLACFFYAQLDTQKIAEELGTDIPEQFQTLSSEYFYEIIIGDAHAAPQLESYSTIGNTTKVHDHYHTYTMNDNGNGQTSDLSGQPAVTGLANHSHIVSNFKVSYVDGHIHEVDKMMFAVDNVLDYRTEALAAEQAAAAAAEAAEAAAAAAAQVAAILALLEEGAEEQLAEEEARLKEEERQAQEAEELVAKQAADIADCEAALMLEQNDAVEQAIAEAQKEMAKAYASGTSKSPEMTNQEMQTLSVAVSTTVEEEQVAAGRWDACANMFSNGTNGRNGGTGTFGGGAGDSYAPNPLPDTGVFSDMFITKDSSGASRFLFFYDEGKDVQTNSANSSIIANMSDTAKNKIIRKKRGGSGAGFTNFKMTRCQVNENATTLNALGSPVKRTALAADNEIKKCVIESYKNIGEVVLSLPGQVPIQGSKSEIRIFTGVDTSLADTTGGTFQYDIEVEVKDGSNEVIDDTASSLSDAASLLTNYMSMAQRPGYFNEKRNKFKVTGFYNETVLENIVDTYLDSAELIYDISPSSRAAKKAQFTKLISPEGGTIQGIEVVEKTLTDLISTIEDTTKQVHTPGSVSDTRAMPKTGKQASSTTVPLKTTNSFSSLVTANFTNDTYVDFFSGQTPSQDIGGLNVYNNFSNMRIVSKTGNTSGPGGSETTTSTEAPPPSTTEICGLSIRTAEASNTTNVSNGTTNNNWFKKSTQSKETTTMQQGASNYLGSGEGASGQMLQVSGSVKAMNIETTSRTVQVAQTEEILANFAAKTMETKSPAKQTQALSAGRAAAGSIVETTVTTATARSRTGRRGTRTTTPTTIPVPQVEYVEYLSGFQLSTPSPAPKTAQLPPSDRQVLLKEPIWVKIPVSDVAALGARMSSDSYLLMRRESQDSMDVVDQYFLYSPSATSPGRRTSQRTTTDTTAAAATPTVASTTIDSQKLARRKASRAREGARQYVSANGAQDSQSTTKTRSRRSQINVETGTALSRKLATAIKEY